jgi:LacI family transcriptional regulator, repressor for deo operon, udp, cdd, tsx, nupC, and nupG
MTNIRKVAELAGVSTATVSRAFSQPDKLSDATLQKVLKAARRSKYKPNLLARNFRSARSYSVVVLVPNIANPFFARIIRGIEEVAQLNGYAVLLGDTRNLAAREAEYLQLVENRRADGAIQLSAAVPSGLTAALPFVHACECTELGRFPTVRIDNARAAQTVCSYLIALGHGRVGVVRGPAASPLTADRLKGYRQALKAAGLAYDASLVLHGDFTLLSGFKAAQTFVQLRSPPTAVFCMNDEMAIGLIHGLKTLGLDVPADMSVAGFDDIEFARFADPPLTTIAQPAEEIGRTAMSALYGLLTGSKHDHKDYVLPTEFVVRESTAQRAI